MAAWIADADKSLSRSALTARKSNPTRAISVPTCLPVTPLAISAAFHSAPYPDDRPFCLVHLLRELAMVNER